MVYGAKIIAQALQDLGVQVIFGLPGLPVTDIGQEALYLGIRFISFRNEQAAVYAATAYGYMTGKPGVCLSVGGPGVFHIVAGIPHATANSWPLLVLSGSSETHNAGKQAFQESDSISFVTPHTKLAVRPPLPEMIPTFVKDAYRAAWFGRPGPAFVDLPANLIMGHFDVPRNQLTPLAETPLCVAPPNKIRDIAEAFKSAKAPLVVIGKGAAYSRAEQQIRALIESTGLPFVPTPMGKGVVADSSPYNIAAARSTALKETDVVLVLGARLNWILSFGLPPKWNPAVKIIQVDICAEELGKNGGDPMLSVVSDIALLVEQLASQLEGWKSPTQSAFRKSLQATRSKNEDRAAKKASVSTLPMTFEKAFDTIKTTLNSLSSSEHGDIVYVSEGANAMDISRSIFTVEHPRIRLDAGTYATMGVGLGYAVAAYAAYNFPNPEGLAGTPGRRKKIVAIEGDSAFGFSGMEVETMSRFQMDCLIFVMNNSGLYRGDTDTSEKWEERRRNTVEGTTQQGKGLTAWSLGYQTGYEKMAEMVGGLGFCVKTPDELKEATRKGFEARVPVVVNVIIDPQADLPMDFSWLDMAPPKKREQKL